MPLHQISPSLAGTRVSSTTQSAYSPNSLPRRCARERRRRRVNNNPTSALTWESQRAIWNGVCMCIQPITPSLFDPLGPHFFALLPNADVPPDVVVVTMPYTPSARHPPWPHFSSIKISFQQSNSPLASRFGVVCRIGERQRGLSLFGAAPSKRQGVFLRNGDGC